MAGRSDVLTDKEMAFVRGFVLTGNATKAYIAAGYSEKGAAQNASNALKKDKIVAAVDIERAEVRKRHIKTLDDIVDEYTVMAFTGMSRFMRIDGNGEPVIDLSDCTSADLDMLAEVTVDTYVEGRGEDQREIRRIKIKPYDRYKALDALAKHLGMFIEGNGKGDGAERGKFADLIAALQERGSSLPVRPTGPMGSGRFLSVVKTDKAG